MEPAIAIVVFFMFVCVLFALMLGYLDGGWPSALRYAGFTLKWFAIVFTIVAILI